MYNLFTIQKRAPSVGANDCLFQLPQWRRTDVSKANQSTGDTH